jgi:dTDP-4-dehydrorhamnose reductase
MKIYVLGGSGMVGTAVLKHFAAHDVVAPGVTSPRIDVTDYNALKESISAVKPDFIIDLVALCDMEACEKKPIVALNTHALGTANVALIASDLHIALLYLSSACAFSGTYPYYRDTDPVHPISTYGKTKVMGEQITRSIPKHYVVRTEWCFGGGPTKDTKFIGKIFRQIKSGQTAIWAVGDKFGSLSYLPDLCKAIEKILQSGKYGTYHVACTGSASRYDIAQEFIRLLGRDMAVNCVPSSFFEKEYDAPRPVSEVLINSEIKGFSARPWKECLAEYAKEFMEE